MAKRITVVVSQGQSANPAKRGREEDLVAALLMESGVEIVIVPHLYDLQPESTGVLALQSPHGDMVVVSWLFPRAAHWTLARHDVLGRFGVTLLASEDEEEEEGDGEEQSKAEDDKQRVADERPTPNRSLYFLDLRGDASIEEMVEEIKRIAAESSIELAPLTDWIGGSPAADQMNRFLQPTNDTHLGAVSPAEANNNNGNGEAGDNTNGNGAAKQVSEAGAIQPLRIDEEAPRRWYPVIDFGRCTNCMECIDFCLFGVYGVDQAETILVEQPDNCRKGCPACSRVCPENAIIFPQHKTPAIAGSNDAIASMKIDLSQLFGAPASGKSAEEVAAMERDEQLVAAGRDAVGMAVGMPKRSEMRETQERDKLDDLIDELDDLDV